MGKTKRKPVNEYVILQKINRKVAYKLRHWDQYSMGMFLGTDCYDFINNAFDELCVLYKDSSLYSIPFGISMISQISVMVEEACNGLTRNEKQILEKSYREICLDEEDFCVTCDCLSCDSFNEYLVKEFEGYLTDYTTAKIDQAYYG